MDGRATSPTWGPPPPCKQALSLMNGVLLEKFLILLITDLPEKK